MILTFLSWTAVEESKEVCSTVGRERGRMVVRVTTDTMGDMVRLVTMDCDPGEPGVMLVTHSSDHADELD